MRREDHRRRLEELFFLATELEAHERPAFFERHCGEDRELRRDLEVLLREDDHGTKDFLRSDALLGEVSEAPCESHWLPERVGPYRLVRPLGAGGMGTVWLAEQEGPVQRQVAVKLVRTGRRGERETARFESECGALARLSHAGIARIFDSGSVDGRPWFAMEYVSGEPIDEYCDRQRLGVRERILLFCQVCDAVQHAHHQGVVHRDVKPSNVLVLEQGGEAAAKLIDFGIASVDGDGEGKLGERAPTDVAGTRTHISPEQSDPERYGVDTRTDVYSLGVLLYQLLVGRTPIDDAELRGTSLRELRSILESARRAAPSEVLALEDSASVEIAAARRTTPARLARRLRGDLDWIALQAASADRAARYATASELAADLHRHLHREPVLAAPRRLSYVAWRTVQRHRWAVLASVPVLLLLLAAAVLTVRASFEANRERDSARQRAVELEAVTEFLSDTLAIADPAVSLDPDVTVQALLESASARLERGYRGMPSAEAMLRRTIGSAYQSLGDLEQAEHHLERALELLDESQETSWPERSATMWALVGVFDELDSRKGLELATRLWAEQADWVESVDPPLARALRDMVDELRAGRLQGALDRLEPIRARVAELEPTDEPMTLVVASAFADLGYVLLNFFGDTRALPFFEESLRLRRGKLAPNHPQVAETLGWMVEVLLLDGRLHEAEDRARACLDALRTTLPDGHWRTIEASSRLGECLARQGRSTEAGPLLAASFHALAESRGLDSRVCIEAGERYVRSLERTGRREEADELRRELAPAFAFSRSSPVRWHRQEVLFGAEHAVLIAHMRLVADRAIPESDPPASGGDPRPTSAALDDLLRALDATLPRQDARSAVIGRQLVEWSYYFQGEQDDVAAALQEAALDLLRAHGERTPNALADAHLGLGRRALLAGRAADAERELSRALELFQRSLGRRSFSTTAARISLGESLVAQGRFAEAEPLLLDAADGLVDMLGDADGLTRYALAELAELYEAWGDPDRARAWRDRLERAGVDGDGPQPRFAPRP